jgi:hypothetical protein
MFASRFLPMEEGLERCSSFSHLDAMISKICAGPGIAGADFACSPLCFMQTHLNHRDPKMMQVSPDLGRGGIRIKVE